MQAPPPQVQPPIPPDPAEHNAFVRSFVTGLMKQNPESVATTLESLSRLNPDYAETLLPWAGKAREFAKLSPAEYAPQAKDFFTSLQGGIGPTLTFLGEGLGQVAS